ncbi:LysM peptidoglycan-binding domain-containing protein [Streptomyces virginiae]|uniref:LysM peptidoglycan-binding domain-containing protein n=1 Tax=Streptomyces virginiae TaxID=1961 RepID=UPI0022574F7E|nr:LysM peptidoglycan-binding domain-containing protein [Streptomyces virginiae]MCX5174313.1 LysM peptidoglycan-binding domain-containing protein [Streptomyces virginiae]
MSKPTLKPSPPARGGAQAAAAVARGLLSLTVLAALLVGLPILLWWATTIVGPPGAAALGSLFSTDDSGQVFLLALAVAGWVGWVLFACAVLLEIPAQLRGRAAPQIRGLVGQRAAAALVGAVLLALPTTTALAAPATAVPAAPPVSASASAVPTPMTATTPLSADEATRSAYTVRDLRPAESLWSIAEQTLGDGQRWEEIAALNEGRTMTDGSVFRTDHPIQPGWLLTLPTTAGTDGTPAQGTTPGPRGDTGIEYSVRKGDSLTSIAADQLGNADRYTEIFELNRGKALPDGAGTFTDPDLIHPGQRLTLPGTGRPPAAEPPTTAPGPEKTGSGATTKPPATATPTPPAAHAAPGAGTSTPAPLTTAPVPSPHTPGPEASPSGAQHAADLTSRTVGINWALVAGVGTLLAASLAGALGVRRILQQRRRRAGQTIAQDAEPTRLEQTLAATSEPVGVELLDTVLRTLAHHAAAHNRGLPGLRGAHLSEAEGVTLLLDEPAEALAPFTSGPDPRTWTLDPQAALMSTEDLQDVQAPYPGLVTLGADDTGLVLTDLTTCRVLLLEGSPDEVLEVARALALELGTCTWTDYSEILTTGLGTRLAGLLPQGRIRTMPHLPAVAADLGELLLEAHQSGEQVLPWLLIGAGDHAETDVIQLADALSTARDLLTAVVLPATEDTRRAFPHGETLSTVPDQQALLASLEIPVTLQRVTDEQYREYVHALQVATEEPAPATGPWEFAEDHGQAAAAGIPLTVRVTSADASPDPGNPFPALFAGAVPSPASAPHPPATATGEAQAENTGRKAAESAPVLPQQQTPGPVDGPADESGVRIEMLGPLRITGGTGSDHAHTLRTTAVAALIHLRPGRTTEYLCRAMDPVNPWSTRTLHSRLSELRNDIGFITDDGHPLLPRPKNGTGYTFHPAVTSDWDHFQHLAARGLAAGPQQGIPDLESAMALVRSKPFDGRTLPWADPIIQEMLSRITDTAHTLARWHTDGDTPDLDAARRTVLHALDIEETSEVLYRDLLHIEWTAGNPTAVHKTVARLQQMARTYDITLDSLTEDTVNLVLSDRPSPVTAG